MEHNKVGEKIIRKQIALCVIKRQLEKDNVKRAIEIAEKNGISVKEFGEIVSKL